MEIVSVCSVQDMVLLASNVVDELSYDLPPTLDSESARQNSFGADRIEMRRDGGTGRRSGLKIVLDTV